MYLRTWVIFAIFRLSLGDVLSNTGENECSNARSAVVTGKFNKISADRAFAAILSGVRNTVVGQGGVIAGGSDHFVPGGDAIVVGGHNNTASGAFAFAGGGGYKQKAAAIHSAVYSGQHGIANKTFAIAIGSFARTDHASAIVLTARNSPDNKKLEDANDIKPTFYCNSKGENSVHICSGDGAGVFINDRNVVDELEALNLKANESAVELAAEKRRVVNLTNEVVTLREELNRTTMDEVAALREALQRLNESIRGECLGNPHGRRMLMEEPCFTFFPSKAPTISPTPEALSTPVGIALVRDREDKVNGEEWTDEELGKLFKEGIKEFSDACALREDLLDRIFTETKSPASRQSRFREIFPACPPPSPTPEPTPEPPLTQIEIATIVGVAIAVAGLFSGLICGNPKVQDYCARKCKACTSSEKGGTGSQREDSAPASGSSDRLLSGEDGSSNDVTKA